MAVRSPGQARADSAFSHRVRTLPHISSLDGVRGLAIVLVLLHHNLRFIFPSGYTGVDVFFVLSGFLITAILLRQLGHADVGRQIRLFYIRRALRLFPAFFALLIVFAAMTIIFFEGRHLRPLLFASTYSVNWASALTDQVPGSMQHLWSLAQEEQFYLLWPLLLVAFLVMRLTRRTIMLVTALLMIFGPVVSALLWLSGTSEGRLYFGLDTHSTGLLLGCLLAQFYIWGVADRLFLDTRFLRWGALLACFALIVIAVGMRTSAPGWIAGILMTPLASILAGVVVLAAVACREGLFIRLMTTRIMRRLGRVSYSLYLWHIPVMYFVAWQLADVLAFRYTVLISFALAYVIAEISYRVVESPFLQMKTRFEAPVPSPGSGYLQASESGSK